MNEKEKKQLDHKLHQIYYKLGPFRIDPQEHANNVIESNSQYAKECLELLGIEIRSLAEVNKYD